MPAKAKHPDGKLGCALVRAKRNRKQTASNLHTADDDARPAEPLVHGLLDPKTRDVVAYEDDLFWNEQMSIRVSRMEEEHSKTRKVILVDRRIKPNTTEVCGQQRWYDMSKKLPIPRRPKWDRSMTPQQLQSHETEEFLTWRREMAKVEEDEQVFLTPFEKNLELWRQLWRVVERSDVIFCILDARNPLVFRNHDLEDYVRGHTDFGGRPKQVVLMLNKADLLSRRQRRAWARHFKRDGVRFIFFSAGRALGEAELERLRLKQLAALEDALENGELSKEEAAAQRVALQPPPESELVKLDAGGHPVDPTYIFGRRDLIHYLHMYARHVGLSGKSADTPPPAPPPRKPGAPKGFTPKGVVVPPKVSLVVGMVGYPNVGKSSTINALFTTKRVVVSATPGKTKHFQTLELDEVVTLCDCPGLVFPSFASTREGMICDGILPVATMREYVAPMDLLLRRIRKEVIEMRYNIDVEWELDQDHSSSFTELVLNIYARHRGMMTEHNKPNQSRAARELLLDYVDGKLLYVHPPPPQPEDDQAHDEEEEEEEEEGDQFAVESLDRTDTASLSDEDDEELDDLGEEEEEEEEEEETEEIELPFDHPPNPEIDPRDAHFNANNVNLPGLYAKMLAKKKGRGNRGTDHLSGMEDIVTIGADGAHVVHLDPEDGIVQIDPGVPKERGLTKRLQRRQHTRTDRVRGRRLVGGYAT